MAGRPLQLILARNLLGSLSTPAFLVAADGELLFFNDAAGGLLGRRFEETGPMGAEEWTAAFGPLDPDGAPVPWERLPLTVALRGNRPAHADFTVRAATGEEHRIEASALPIVGDGGFQGAMVVFWPSAQEAPA
jgi:PAS domain-containing protein